MIKKIIIILLIITALVAGVCIFFYIRSFHTLSITFSSGVSSVVVKKGETAIKEMSENGTVSLQDGSYSIIPKGEKVSSTAIPLTIKGEDKVFTVDPDYSETYLQTTLESESTTVTAAIKNKYPNIDVNFVIGKGALYKKGEWYATTLTQIVENSNDTSDVYRVVLKKEGNSWVTKTTPEIVLSLSKYPEVPESVINSTNNLTGTGTVYRNSRATIDNDYYTVPLE